MTNKNIGRDSLLPDINNKENRLSRPPSFVSEVNKSIPCTCQVTVRNCSPNYFYYLISTLVTINYDGDQYF